MKKMILFISCMWLILMPEVVNASLSVEMALPSPISDCKKALERALKEGRDEGGRGCYKVTFKEKEIVGYDEFLSFMKGNEYYVVSNTIKMVDYSRFGYSNRKVASAKVIPVREFERCIAGIMSGTECTWADVLDLPKMDLSKVGSQRFLNVMWTGNFENGKITCHGVGVSKAKLGSPDVFVISGTFDNGIPQGDCKYVKYECNLNQDGIISWKIVNSQVFPQVSPFKNGYAVITNYDGKKGFINNSGMVVVPCKYMVVLSDFSSDGYAIVKENRNGKELKIDTRGNQVGYSDAQLAADEAARKAAEAEAKRLAEQRQYEIWRQNETVKFNKIKRHYEGFQEDAFWKACEEYAAEYPEERQGSLDSMQAEVRVRSKLIKERSNISNWRTGNQICQITPDGLIIGSIEKFNEDRSAVQITVNAAPAGSYSGQRLTEGRMVWIQKGTGWHLALTAEIVYARNHSSARSIDDPTIVSIQCCHGCNGNGTRPCYSCNGTGWHNGRYDSYICNICNGKGSTMCSSCNGTGR